MKLEGEKIILRKLKLADSESVAKYAKDKEISQYMMSRFPYPYRLKDAQSFIKRAQRQWALKKKSEHTFGIELNKTGEIIGSIALHKIDEHNKKTTLGYWVAKKYWRQGIGTEAVRLIVEFGFEKLKLERIEAGIFHPNKASAKLLEKIGFQYEGLHRHSALRGKKWFDEMWYAILRKEYKG